MSAHRKDTARRRRASAASMIGGAGIALATPAAAFFAAPAVAQAAPPPSANPLCALYEACPTSDTTSLAKNYLTPYLGAATPPSGLDPFGFYDAVLGLSTQIPVLNAFVGNGAAGTAAHPDGFNAGIFAGNGGNGIDGGKGGSAGLFIGNGGNGGNGLVGQAGGAGGAAGLLIGNGGNGGKWRKRHCRHHRSGRDRGR